MWILFILCRPCHEIQMSNIFTVFCDFIGMCANKTWQYVLDSTINFISIHLDSISLEVFQADGKEIFQSYIQI